MIKINGMSYSLPNVGNILTDINLNVSSGDFIGILGRNGAGKTTLIDIMMGFKRPSEGQVLVLGEDPFMSDRSIFKEISYLSQEVGLKSNISLESFFSFHKYFFPNYSRDDEKRLMDIFKLDYKAKIGGLSTGQKRRVQIVASLASKPKILFIDEITAVLDPDARGFFFKILKDINGLQKTTILLATNIVEDLKERVDSVYFIQDRKLEHHQASDINTLFATCEV